MADLIDRELCTGCSACVAACSRNALIMKEDSEGFMMPFADKAKCIDCGVCARICPGNTVANRDESPLCFAAKSNDTSLIKESSSGGMFSEFSLKILSLGGVVFGAAYVGDNLDVKHIRVTSELELGALRGSKYVYSETNKIYRTVKEDLTTKLVLFSGTPCQIAGLKAYLGKEYQNLITIDLICHGTPPARLFNELKTEMFNKHGELVRISFRDKDEGWSARAMTGWYSTGEKIRERGNLNDYFKVFIAHLTLRHSCETCRFNDGKSGADITLGDFWGITSVIPELNDDTGVSAVIIHTKKGEKIFNTIECFKRAVSLCDITSGNPSYLAPRVPEKYRNAFMEYAYKHGIHVAKRRFLKEHKSSIIKRIAQKIAKSCRGGTNI